MHIQCTAKLEKTVILVMTKQTIDGHMITEYAAILTIHDFTFWQLNWSVTMITQFGPLFDELGKGTKLVPI